MAKMHTNPALKLLLDRRGVTTVEFGFVAAPFILTLVAVIIAGFTLYMRNALDNATQRIARKIMTGSVQQMMVNNKQLNASQFQANVVCPQLPAAFNCSNVIINIKTFSESAYPGGYYDFVNAQQSGLILPPLNNANTSYCIGNAGDFILLQILYPLPLLTGIFAGGALASYNGAKMMVLFSNAAFRNEPFPAGTYVTPSGC